MTVQRDDNRPVRRDAMLCVVGNVGKLRGNLTLGPCARPDDGVLDRYIPPPRRFRHLIKLALRLIANQPKRDDQGG
jgi:diacylglycerol kinase (ATP)